MVYVLLAEGFEEIEALTPVDVLRRANIDVMTAGVGGEVVCGAHGIPVVCDTTVEQIPYDSINGIVLPGGMPGTTNLQEDEKVGEMIDFCMDNDRMIAAICAAPMILGELGLLSGRAAVCFPGFESNLHGADISDAAVAASDNIITSRGAGTALEFRREIPENQKKEQSRRIAARLFETVEYQNAESVFVFISVKDETDTSEIIKQCFKDKKRVAVPLCNTKEHTMTAIEIFDSGQVERGAYGIFEPKHSLINSGELLPLLNPSIVLVPGAAFDERGMRIGMGGGYYDRYLADFGGVSIGLCYSQCLAEILVGGIYDRCVDMVICPDVTLDMRRNGQNKNFS